MYDAIICSWRRRWWWWWRWQWRSIHTQTTLNELEFGCHPWFSWIIMIYHVSKSKKSGCVIVSHQRSAGVVLAWAIKGTSCLEMLRLLSLHWIGFCTHRLWWNSSWYGVKILGKIKLDQKDPHIYKTWNTLEIWWHFLFHRCSRNAEMRLLIAEAHSIGHSVSPLRFAEDTTPEFPFKEKIFQCYQTPSSMTAVSFLCQTLIQESALALSASFPEAGKWKDSKTITT